MLNGPEVQGTLKNVGTNSHVLGDRPVRRPVSLTGSLTRGLLCPIWASPRYRCVPGGLTPDLLTPFR